MTRQRPTAGRPGRPGASSPGARSGLSLAIATAFGASLVVAGPAAAAPVTLVPANLRAEALTAGLPPNPALDCTATSAALASPATATCLPSGNFYALPTAISSARAGTDWGLQVAGQSRGSSVSSTARIQTGFTNGTSDTLRFSYSYLIGAGSLVLGTGIGLEVENPTTGVIAPYLVISGTMQAQARLRSMITIAAPGGTSVSESAVQIDFDPVGPDPFSRTNDFTGLAGFTAGPSSVSWADTVFSVPILLDLLPGQSFTMTHELMGTAFATEPSGYCCSGTRCSATYSGAEQSLGGIAALALGLTYERLTGGEPGGGSGGQVLLPGTLLLGAAGLAGMGLARRRRR
jgi:hypothetical protein